MAIPSLRPVFLFWGCLAVLCSTSVLASDPILVRDINLSGSSAPTALQGVGGRLYFQADNGVNGVELWTSDGTEAGTFLVRDLMPGPPGSYPRSFAGLEDAIYFSGNDGLSGHELWSTDGTEAGTAMVRDVNPGAADSWPGVSTGLVRLGQTLVFEAYTNSAGYEPWKTDGTSAGTALVKDIRPGSEGSSSLGFVPMNGSLFFRADDGLPPTNRELWKTDGTDQGTAMVRDINPSGGSDPSELVVLNGVLLFDADDGVHGEELWSSDGTEGGTMLVRDINPSGGSFPGQLRIADGMLFFVANDGTNGSELWQSDGTEQGTVMLVDLNASGSSAITHLTVVGNSLYFVLRSGALREQLWTSDGTAAGTVMLREFDPRNYHPMVENLTDVEGTLFFSANDGVHGVELWKSDGTSEGTVLAGDIYPGNQWSFSWPQYLRNVNGVLFLAADDGVHGRELWALDTRGTSGIPEVQAPPAGEVWLRGSAPNPFNLATTLWFDLSASSPVSVRIYDATGRHVRELLAGGRLEAGPHTVQWDGRNDRGTQAESGVYFYRLEAGANRREGRVVLAR